jgi:galactose oxidase
MLFSPKGFGLVCLNAILFSTQAAAQYPWAQAISRSGWVASANSFQAGNEAARAIDGNTSTFWHSQYTPSVAPLPHYIQVDMQRSYVVNGISYQPRQGDSNNGHIGQHTVTVSNDGQTWSQPVAFGAYLNDDVTKYTFFTNTTARYVRLTAQSEAQDPANQWASAADFRVYSPNTSQNAGSFQPPPPATRGRWGATVDMQIVPAAGALASDGRVIFWSAYRPDLFGGGTGLTHTTVWDPSSQAVSQLVVSNTGHDMFCPGISLDVNGRFIVTGGNDNAKTSNYDPATDSWITAAQMNVGRGYQSSTTVGDGRIFTIGGSWSGGRFEKDGEIYDPEADTWTELPGCSVTPMLTDDAQGIFRSDNHAFLFAYRQNSVFQAGPSVAMNWYNVTGNTGSWTAAGNRGNDADAMCGIAVMYDAVAGLILTAGGSPDYQDSDATRNAFLIDLGDVNANPTVTRLPSMAYPRAFGNGVVLPDGKVFVVGGQARAIPFTDTTAAMPAELFDPVTRTWTQLASISVPRTYHSIALLLPDATVVAGGGGLCGTNCAQNHFDVQVFSPPYLFNSDGTLATRPTIRSASPLQVAPGGTLTVTTSTAATFSLVRFGSSTHTVNTDQRRVPLTATANGLTYTMSLPSDPGVLLPGYWMLFAINSAGVPSVATTVQVLLA